MWSRPIAVAALVLALGAACSDDGTGAADSSATTADAGVADGAAAGDGASCAIAKHADDIVADHGKAVALPDVAAGAAANATHAFVCGAGYLAAVSAPGSSGGVPPATVVHRDTLLTSPCAVAVSGARVVVATRAGALVALRFDGKSFSALGSAASLASTLHDVVADGDTLYLAAGASGVLSLSIAGDKLAATPTMLPGARDARGVALTAGGDLLVADGHQPGEKSSGGGAQIRLISVSGAGVLGELTKLWGIATHTLVDGDRAVVLRPGEGFDVLDVSNHKLALRYSVIVDSGLPYGALLEGDELLVAAGATLLRYRLGASDAQLLSREGRPDRGSLESRWYRGALRVGAGSDARRYALTDRSLVPITLGNGAPAPAIAVEDGTLTLLSGQREALFRVHNFGNAPLVISGLSADAPFSVAVYTDLSKPRPGCPTQYLVPPGDVLLAWHRNSATTYVDAPIRLLSNDPDDAIFRVRGEANRPTVAVGDSVDDFALLSVRGRRFLLSQQRGRALLAKLYNRT